MPTTATPCAPSSAPRTYARRQPEKTALHLVVREHLETFLATVREQRGKDLPRYVEEELRRYVRCGVLQFGFLRVVCPTCKKEILVGFSCKCRGSCPSCSARRMCDCAAHLVDHVMPDVPVRQWVLTAPHEVRRVLALRPAAHTACGRIFVEEIARLQKAQAKARGKNGGETGAVTFVQRFDGRLGCFVHFHEMVPDGVFVRDDAGTVTFFETPAPSRLDVAAVAERVKKRMMRWVRRRGLIDDRPPEERSNEAPAPSPLEACMQMSLFGGTFLRLDADGTPLDLDDECWRVRGKSPWAAEVCGFNVHAGVTVRDGDRDGLERLFRYGARPPFSLERISLLPDGRVAYRLRKARRNGATHLVLEPLHFLARISSIIPPPRYPLLRLSGVFAPSSPWRSSVVPSGPVTRRASASTPPVSKKKLKKPSAAAMRTVAAPDAEPSTSAASLASGPRTSLGSGIAKPADGRIDWASLLRRVYLEDVLACPCGGRRRILADISEREALVAILAHLGLPTEAPPFARARSPSFDAA